nr:hypothetical protein [Tanacetum cinerariifolium]
MDITIDQQVTLDEALVPHASRLRIGKSNFRLRSDLKSKESTLQVVYDVLKLTPFYKAFLVTTDVPTIYMQELWATTTVHYYSIRFKTNNKKHIINLEYFRENIQICLRIPNQPFDELPFEEESLAFLRELGHSVFDYLKLKSFGACTIRRTWIFPIFRGRILCIRINPSQGKNKVNWHFARVDHMFTMIKLVSRHQNTQQYGAILPIKLTNEAIKNSKSYKEYYAIASGAAPPKTKASIRKKQSSSDTTVPPPTAKGKRVKTSAKVDKPAKEKQPAKSSKAKGLTVLSEVALTKDKQMKLATKRSLTQTHISHFNGSGADEGTGIIPGVPDVPIYESDDEEISWKSSEEDDDDEVKINEHDEDVDDQSDDDDRDDQDDDDDQDDKDDDDDDDEQTDSDNDIQTPSHVENTDDEDNDDDSHGMNVEGDKGANEKDDGNDLYEDVNINLEGRDIQMSDVQTTQVIEDTHVTLTSVNPEGQQQNVSVTTTVEPPLLSATTLPPPFIFIIPHVQQTPTPSPVNVPSSSLQDLPNFRSLFVFDHKLKALETNFSEFMQTNQFAKAISLILDIVDKYLKHRMNEAMKVVVQLQSEKLRDEAQAENEDFLNKLDENIQKIIKEQVKEQVKTFHAVAVDLSELELNKILIAKMESNKSIHRSDEHKNLYKALVDAYKCDKLILDTYGETVTLKRRRDDEDKDEEPSAGSNRGSKRRCAGKEPESTNAPKEKTSRTTGKSTEGSKSYHKTASDNMAKKANSRTSFNELMDTLVDFSTFVMNRLKVDTLTPELLAGLTYKMMKGSCKSLVELEFFLEEVYKEITDQLDWNNPEGQQYPHDLLKPLPLIPNSRGHRIIPFDHFINNDLEYLRGGVSSRKNTTLVTKTKATDYRHIKWIGSLYKHRHPTACGSLQLGVKSYQKKLNLTNPDTYRSDLKRKEAYTAYSNPRGFIYQNKDKQNRLMHIDELHKFNDGTLNDVRTALDDRLKGIQM